MTTVTTLPGLVRNRVDSPSSNPFLSVICSVGVRMGRHMRFFEVRVEARR